jgi:3-oxoacyl-[acyl-carrier protein] reductase
VGVNYVANSEEARKVVNSIIESGGRAVAVQGDVSAKQDVERVFDEVSTALGDIDIVINAAGASAFAPLPMASVDDLERLIAVNVRGAFHVLSGAARRVRDGGRIVQISTGGTTMPIAAGGLYLGTKSAGELMALCLAKELGSRGVTVNVVSPGLTRTDGLVMPQEALEELVRQIPLGRLGEPEDIAEVIAFLAGPDARWMTAQNVRPTGGLV